MRTDSKAITNEGTDQDVLPVIRYSDPDDAVARANAPPYGLGASIWCVDSARAYDLSTRAEAGTVWVNKHADMGP